MVGAWWKKSLMPLLVGALVLRLPIGWGGTSLSSGGLAVAVT